LRRRSAPQTSAMNPFIPLHQRSSLSGTTFIHRNLYPIEVERGYIVADIILHDSTKKRQYIFLE